MTAHSPNTYAKVLRTAGSRITSNRVALLKVLERSTTPLSIEAIRRAMRDSSVNEATIYRIVKALVKAGVAHKIELRHGHTHVELANRPHHHHFLCEHCGRIINLHVNRDRTLIQALERQHGFTVRDHSLELFGRCKNCRRKTRRGQPHKNR